MSPRGPKLQELADAVRDIVAGDTKAGIAKATVTICFGPICIEIDVDEDTLDEILKPIPIGDILKGQQ